MDRDTLPTLERLTAAADVVTWLGERAGNLPDDPPNGLAMKMHLTVASLYLAEYAKHLIDGMEPYDALLATARGELKLSQQQQDLLRSVWPAIQRDNDSDAAR